MPDYLLSSNVFFLALELGVLALAALLSLFGPSQPWLLRVEAAFTRFAEHRGRAVTAVAAAVIMGRIALLPLFPVPVPGVHDEYSYLLNGATFALGRLTNPPTPIWQPLESFHILQRPTYGSMYPVAQGLSLAVGFLLKCPWLGVLLGVALFCGALTWALQGWLSPQWALLGGALAVLKFGLVSYWIDSYWGGAIPALGGALVIGAAPRLRERTKVSDAIWLALGTLILANSRPFEGLLVVTSVCAWLLWQASTKAWAVNARKLAIVSIPATTLLIAGFAGMALYFRATTGHMTKMPYEQYADEYSITRPFLWQSPRPEPVFHNAVMQQYYERERPLYARAHTLAGFSGELARKLSSIAMFYLWPGLLLLVLTLPRVLRTEEGRFSLLVAGAVIAGIAFEIWPMMLHYPAPATTAMVLLLVCAIRTIRQLTFRSRSLGIGLSRAIPVLCVGAMSLRIVAAATGAPVPDHGLIPYLTISAGNVARERIIEALHDERGQHLVLVRYGPQHDLSHEWVYNSPSIFTAPIVWARDLNPSATNDLLHQFPGRKVWLLQPDEQPPLLARYPETRCQP